MTKTSFCGIFATLFVTTTMVLLASCSQDDDYYESDMYTLAEMGTRLGDPEPGGGEASVVYSSYNLVADAGEHWIPFFRQGIPSGEYLQIHLYALADSAFAQWGGYTKAMNKKVSVRYSNHEKRNPRSTVIQYNQGLQLF